EDGGKTKRNAELECPAEDRIVVELDMNGTSPRGRLRQGLAIVALAAACQTTRADVDRWATTENGPVKLRAVMSHSKYDVKLRADAALALAGMKPRGGRRIGIDVLLDTLTQLPPRLRQDVVPLLTDALVERLKGSAHEGQDPTLPFKDVAHALLR